MQSHSVNARTILVIMYWLNLILHAALQRLRVVRHRYQEIQTQLCES